MEFCFELYGRYQGVKCYCCFKLIIFVIYTLFLFMMQKKFFKN